MVIPIIMAIWLGVRARHMGRNWVGWALVGFILPVVVSSLTVNGLSFAISGGTMEMAPELYLALMLVGAMTGIIVTVYVGRKALKPQQTPPLKTYQSTLSEGSPRTDATWEESHREPVDHNRSR